MKLGKRVIEEAKYKKFVILRFPVINSHYIVFQMLMKWIDKVCRITLLIYYTTSDNKRENIDNEFFLKRFYEDKAIETPIKMDY